MRKLQFVIYVVVGWYLFLVTLHYFGQRPLWNDEYCIFINIHKTPLGQLFNHSLTSDQEFPRLYLYGIGLLSQSFSYHLLALRLFPFLCMLGAFFIWIYLLKKQLPSQMAQLTVLLCWAASAPLIYYAAELKQYSMDVLVGAVFLLFLYHQKNLQEQVSGLVYSLILMALALLSLFSYVSLFFVLLPLFNLWTDAKKTPSLFKFFGVYLVSIVVCCLTIYWYDFRVSKTDLLVTYWKDYFISFDSFGSFFQSVGEAWNTLVSRWFAQKPKGVRMASRFFMSIGFLWLLWISWPAFKKEGFRFNNVRNITGLVLLECLILASFQKYPLIPRTLLFLAPMFLFLTADALEEIKQRNKIIYALVEYPFIGFLCYVSLGIAGIIFASQLGAEPAIWG